MSAYFITVEGIEGVGKSTNIQFIQQFLTQHHVSVLLTREPGGTPISEEIRKIILHKHADKMHADTELLLLFASRAQHFHQVIEPALARGEWVVSDRFTDASYAYQGGGRGIPPQRIAALETWVLGNKRPDLTLLFDAPAELALQRTRARGALDRIEEEEIAFFKRVRECYLQRAKHAPQQYQVIDATQSLAEIQQQLSSLLRDIVENFHARKS